MTHSFFRPCARLAFRARLAFHACLAFVSVRLKYAKIRLFCRLICIPYCDTGSAYLIRTVCRHIFIFVQLFFKDCRSFTSRKLYVFPKTFWCFLNQFHWAHSKEIETTITCTEWTRCPQLKYVWRSIYSYLYHAIEKTANQNAGRPLYFRQYFTEHSYRSVQFNCITINLPIWPLYFLWHGIK